MVRTLIAVALATLSLTEIKDGEALLGDLAGVETTAESVLFRDIEIPDLLDTGSDPEAMDPTVLPELIEVEDQDKVEIVKGTNPNADKEPEEDPDVEPEEAPLDPEYIDPVYVEPVEEYVETNYVEPSYTETYGSSYEVDLLSRLVEAEATGESYVGRVAVAEVVLNRVNSSIFPNSIEGVVYDAGQFSPVTDGRIHMSASQSSIDAVQEAMTGTNHAGGALYFYNPAVTGFIGWFESMETTAVIGNHYFKK